MGMLDNRVAWIHGAAGAVGLACAQSLAQAGATVVLSGRDSAKLQAALQQVSGRAHAVCVDISERAAVFAAADAIEQTHGRIDILVNSAGVNPRQRHWKDLSFEDWQNSVDVNLTGLFNTCQASLRGMRQRQDGVIINIASWAGHFAAYFAGPAYASTKRAVLALTETINMEECIHGIRATSISPAGIDTPLLDKRPVPPTAAMRATLLKPADVADMVTHVAGLPAHVCINDILMSPRMNLPYLGELETAKRPPAQTN